MTYEQFVKMLINFFEDHPIKIQIDKYHPEESFIDEDGNITINLETWFDD